MHLWPHMEEVLKVTLHWATIQPSQRTGCVRYAMEGYGMDARLSRGLCQVWVTLVFFAASGKCVFMGHIQVGSLETDAYRRRNGMRDLC